MATQSPLRPNFARVDIDTAHQLMTDAGARRDWSEVRKLLIDGERLFFSEAQFTPSNAKYVKLSLARNGERRVLHVRHSSHEGVEGRLVWLGEERNRSNGTS